MMQQRSMSHLAHSLGIRQDYKNAGHYLRKVSVFFSKGSGLAGEQVRAEHFLGIRNEAKGVHAAVEGCACGG